MGSVNYLLQLLISSHSLDYSGIYEIFIRITSYKGCICTFISFFSLKVCTHTSEKSLGIFVSNTLWNEVSPIREHHKSPQVFSPHWVHVCIGFRSNPNGHSLKGGPLLLLFEVPREGQFLHLRQLEFYTYTHWKVRTLWDVTDQRINSGNARGKYERIC